MPIQLANAHLSWELDWTGGALRTVAIENRLTSLRITPTATRELALTFSADPDGLAEPRTRFEDLAVREVRARDDEHAVFELTHAYLDIALHYELVGATRRKWVEVTDRGGVDLLLLDIGLDDLTLDASTTGGGLGAPVFVEDELYAAVEHPAGVNEAEGGRVRLLHHPGRRLLPGETFTSRVAVVGVTPAGRAEDQFVAHIRERCLRKPRLVSVYTPFGINNQWGACPTLDDEQTLDVLQLLAQKQRKGVRFDYFTLDTGWVDPDSNLTRFKPAAYPNGPGEVIERVQALGMKLGLWFALGWGTQSCWDYPPAFADGEPPGLPYREGYPLTLGGLSFCLGTERYHHILRTAVLHHVRENGVRFVKFDGGLDACSDPSHDHLPAPYSLELMYDRLIGVADSAREIAPDLFVMWYWGLRSPFWALHGDTIFESGLHMEGSGTSATPTLYYRDSVTLAQDQNAQHARLIPPIAKDSLGVWLADTRWGNFMGKERWRESLVMDLGRGNLLFPNIWGDLYHLTDDDDRFLANVTALARRYEQVLLQPRHSVGSAWEDAPYGYSYFHGARGLVFLSNPHFASRPVELPLDESIGLASRPATALRIASHFPERECVARPDGSPYRTGERVKLWLRPFETLLLEVRRSRASSSPPLPLRTVEEREATGLGQRLELQPFELDRRLRVEFADAERFAGRGLTQQSRAFAATLPALDGPQSILAVVIRLRRGDDEWRYEPKPVEIVQVVAQVDDRMVQLIPVPDGRQYGNTQRAGCSWVLYKIRLSRDWSGRPLRFAVHAFLPGDVEPRVEAWVVKRWWREDSRPQSDGYYTDAPS